MHVRFPYNRALFQAPDVGRLNMLLYCTGYTYTSLTILNIIMHTLSERLHTILHALRQHFPIKRLAYFVVSPQLGSYCGLSSLELLKVQFIVIHCLSVTLSVTIEKKEESGLKRSSQRKGLKLLCQYVVICQPS